MFPPEIVDHILSFLQWDHATLSVCAKVHPSLARLVERHFYTHLSVGNSAYSPSELLKLIVDKPNIAKHVRSLQIVLPSPSRNFSFYPDIGLILRQVTRLVSIGLSSPQKPIIWNFLYESFHTAFISCLQLPTLTDVQVSDIHAFPLSVLNHSNSLTRLSLSRGSYHLPSAVYSRLDSLVLNQCSLTAVETIVSWAGSSNLRSLEFLGDLRSFTRLLEAYAKTLTNVKVHVPA